MHPSKYTVIVFAALTLIPAAWCQSAIPAPLSGNQGTPRFSGETEPINVLSLDLGIATHFDDNALSTNEHKVSNFIYDFAPRISWDISRPQWSFSADSLTTVSYSHNVPGYGRFNENFIVSFDFRPVKRLDFRVRNSFNRSTDPFNRYPGSSVPDFGTPDQPNPSFLGPPTTRTSDQVGADATYQLGPHTNLGVSGTFALIQYDRLTAAPSFVQPDTYTATGRAFVSHQFSPRHTSSLAYGIQRFTFSNSVGATTHTITYYHTVALTPSMTFSVWGGPEYIRSGSTSIVIPPFVFVFPPKASWSWTAGGSFGWTHSRTGITAGVSRQVSDGGGLGYVVQSVGANVGVRQQLSRRWKAGAYVSYYDNDSISNFGNFGTRYFSGSVDVTHNFTPHLWLTVGYWRSRQGSSRGLGLPIPAADHNRAAISLHYTFSRSLGS